MKLKSQGEKVLSGLTGIAKSRCDASTGPLAAELGHAAVSLHGERVVEV